MAEDQPIKEEKSLPPPSEESEKDEGNITRDIVLSKDGLKLFPQPVQGDSLDPLNWSAAQKHAILAIVMALYFMFTYITTVTVPSFPTLEEKYNATAEQINWTVAIPALGLALGPLIWSSPAETIGRRPIFILGTIMALVATIGAALASNYSGYMAARFFQGLGVSPASTVGLAMVNDVFFEHERGQKVGLWVLAIDLGLLFGPLIGGFIDLAGDVWVQWVTAIMFGVILVAQLVFLPETLYPRRFMSERRNSEPSIKGVHEGSEDLGSYPDDIRRTKGLGLVNFKPLPGMAHPKLWDTLVRFFRTFKFVVISVTIITYCFAWYWWVLSVITLIPVAYEDYSPQSQGLLFLGLIIGTLVSEICFSGRLSDWLVLKFAKKANGMKNPEMRLWLAYPAAVLTAVGLILWGVSVDKNYHWIVGQVAFVLFSAGIQMGNTAVCSYVIDAYPLQSMSVIVFYAVMLNLSAFVDPFIIAPWLDSMGFTWTFVTHGFITLFIAVPMLAFVHIYGGRMRERNGIPAWVNPEFGQSSAFYILHRNYGHLQVR